MPAFRLDELVDLLAFYRQNGVITAVDVVIPQGTAIPADLRPLLRQCDYFMPNDDEARLLTGLDGAQEQLRFFLAHEAHTVFIKRGRHGVLAGRGSQSWQAGIYPMTQVDPSGSGDAFDAGVMLGILHGWDMPATLRYASALGASAIRALGTTDGVFTAAEANDFIRTHPLDVQTVS